MLIAHGPHDRQNASTSWCIRGQKKLRRSTVTVLKSPRWPRPSCILSISNSFTLLPLKRTPRIKAVARRFDFCGDFLRRPDGDENSEKLSPPSRNLLRGSSAKSPPIQRRCYGDRGREIWDERHSANFGGGRFGSPKKRRRFQGSSASPQNLRQTLQTRIT